MERFFAELNKGKLMALLEVGRPWNAIPCALLALSAIAFSTPVPDLLKSSLSAVSVFLIYLGGAALNDLYDLHIDRINMPFRPIQRGTISEDNVKKFSTACYLLSFIAAASVGEKFFIFSLFFAIMTIAYSVPPMRFVNRGFLAQLHLAATTALVPAYGGTIVATNSFQPNWTLLTTFAAFSAFFAFALIIKDFKDVKGDKNGGKKTVVIQLGEKNAKVVLMAGTAIFFPLTVLLLDAYFKNIAFLLLSAILLIVLLKIESESKEGDDSSFAKLRLTVFVFLLVVLGLSWLKPT